jgi:hypothetical protein
VILGNSPPSWTWQGTSDGDLSVDEWMVMVTFRHEFTMKNPSMVNHG